MLQTKSLRNKIPFASERDCTIKNVKGYLKSVCEDGSKTTLKCANSEIIYDVLEVHNDHTLLSEVCINDPKFYQACTSRAFIQSGANSLLCGQYVCQRESVNKTMICHEKENQICSNTILIFG